MPDSAPSNVVQASPGVEPKSWLNQNIAPILAFLTVGAGFVYLFCGDGVDTAAVVALMAAVIGFYYGSSPGSHDKDKTIAGLKSPGR